MVIELPLVFALPIHLGHLFQAREHGLPQAIICGVDNLPNLQGVRTNELILDSANVCRESFDERHNAVALFARQLRLFYPFNALALCTV